MKVRTIADLIDAVYRARGIEPTVVTLTASQKARVLVLINTELAAVWESEWWPDLMRVEKRTVAEGPMVELVEDGETEIGAIDVENGVFREDPRYNPAAERVTKVTLMDGALHFGDGVTEEGDEVWLKFRLQTAEFTLTAWSSSAAYVAGNLVFVAATGHTYRALKAGTNKAPQSETEYWEVVGVPLAFFNYLTLRVSAAGMVEEEGRGAQFDRASEEKERIQGTVVDAQARSPRVARVRF